MASSSIFPILLLILFHLLLATRPTSSGRVPPRRKQTGFRAPLTRVSSSKTTTTNPLDASLLASRMTVVKDVYVMSVAIGTPPVPFSAIMDTGSSLIWTKCITNGSSFFDYTKSISFSALTESCNYFGLPDCVQSYASGLAISVTLGQEILTIGDKQIPNLKFACGEPHEDFEHDGIVGMGPGALSLVSQSEDSVFSYCLDLESRFGTGTSSVLLTGSEARTNNADVQTTPMATKDSNYYITLEGISVGQTRLAVTKSDFPSNAEMVIDSGTTFTYLDTATIEMISNEFANQTNLEKYKGDYGAYYENLEHCFNASGNDQIPNMVFHFEGADWELPRENYIYQQPGKDLMCLAFIADDNQFIFGNMQQQNMLVIYDLDNKNLSFKPANCNLL